MQAVEICAGAGGQALGLELAGFNHALAVEIDTNAATTLRENRDWDVAVGDVADMAVWNPDDYHGIDLLAGGVPCPPFSGAGNQRGATDERDLFAWAVEAAGRMQPRALILENVKGLSTARFSAYRQHVLDRLNALGYWADWRLLHAVDFGVAQLRPRFVLVALHPSDAEYFHWPVPTGNAPTVGAILEDLMASNGWNGAAAWASRANAIAPTIVGGSKRHGGADLGPTRAKKAWRLLGVDAMGVADAAPTPDTPLDHFPRLTVEMVARLQGWVGKDYDWTFTGRKTSRYRQVGNAFPPPFARAIGDSVARALRHEGEIRTLDTAESQAVHDPVYRKLIEHGGYTDESDLLGLVSGDPTQLERHLRHLGLDFDISSRKYRGRRQYRIGGFRGFVGQDDHARHAAFAEQRRLIS